MKIQVHLGERAAVIPFGIATAFFRVWGYTLSVGRRDGWPGKRKGAKGLRVCAEALFALNWAIDTTLLACSAQLCGERLRWGRLAASGLLGGVYAVAAVLPGAGFLRLAAVEVCAAGLICLAAFGASGRLFRLTAFFFALAACFAGIVFAVTQTVGTGLLRLPGGGVYPVNAAGLLAVAAVLLALCRLLFSGFAQHTRREVRELTLSLCGRTLSLRALLDTGNTLKDPLTNEPVLVANWTAAQTLLPGVSLCEADFHHAPELLQRLSRQAPEVKCRLIPYRAVGVREGLLLAVRCTVQEKGGDRQKALAAFSPTPVSGGEFEALTGGRI